MSKETILQNAKVIILAAILAAGIGSLGAWSDPPTGTPPSCPLSNPACNPPVHTGSQSQSKAGGLDLGSLIVNGGSYFAGKVGVGVMSPASELEVAGKIVTTKFKMTEGAADGYILTSNAGGTASWLAPTGGLGVRFDGVQMFTAVGAQSWTAPAGVTKIFVEVWGGGGGGGGQYCSGGDGGAGGGGGGGGYAADIVPVSPGTSYSVSVGAGGVGVGALGSGGNGAAGGSSSFASNAVATGGAGGAGGGSYDAGLGGAGGVGSAGGILFSGGDGGAGKIGTRGGAGGDSPKGGAGAPLGAGRATVPGGGGAGGEKVTDCSLVSSGSNGAKGRVIVWY